MNFITAYGFRKTISQYLVYFRVFQLEELQGNFSLITFSKLFYIVSFSLIYFCLLSDSLLLVLSHSVLFLAILFLPNPSLDKIHFY